jgi:hypothetical protein
MNYLARVELHNANYQDYERLHASMQKRGFLRTIVGDNGKRQLPTGTYLVQGSGVPLEGAYSAAEAAANETGKTFWVIVVDWDSARYRLPQ